MPRETYLYKKCFITFYLNSWCSWEKVVSFALGIGILNLRQAKVSVEDAWWIFSYITGTSTFLTLKRFDPENSLALCKQTTSQLWGISAPLLFYFVLFLHCVSVESMRSKICISHVFYHCSWCHWKILQERHKSTFLLERHRYPNGVSSSLTIKFLEEAAYVETQT